MTNDCLPYDNLQIILSTIEELNAYKDIDAILDKLLFEVRKSTHADAGSIFLLDRNRLKFCHIQNDTLFDGIRGQAELYADFTIPLDGTSIVGYAAMTGETISIDNAYEISRDLPYAFNPSFDEKYGYKTISILAIPLKAIQSKMMGVMQLINAKDENGNVVPFDAFSHISVPLFANNASLAIEKGVMNRELILRMMRMAELRDPTETGAHVQRVGAYSSQIYQQLAIKRKTPAHEIKQTKDLIRLASMLHDIGKIGIQDSILNKPAKLTPEEFDTMKWHPVHGARLFENTTSQLDLMSREISLFHHEKWDGSGYPGKVKDLNTSAPKMGRPWKGKQIPLAARITALADVYDALASKRSYKEAWTEDRILTTIEKESGHHFDPEVVAAFLDIQDVIKAIRNLYEEKP
ncbi:MAG: HD domain-containing protein [Proteobacteria bacterium]|nr:HD domain-containing protein [Desulfobacula sp.]MBU3954472.1 HD domain-containing protein [Pseudomonadota bacterium]MBU4130666.1 HD domain-containing protein [Pseudomonadota bacterium]